MPSLHELSFGFLDTLAAHLRLMAYLLAVTDERAVWRRLSSCIIVKPASDNLSEKIASSFNNTVITIRTGVDAIHLTTQQKALSDWRMSGLHATQFSGEYKNWHKENLDGTLKALTELGKRN